MRRQMLGRDALRSLRANQRRTCVIGLGLCAVLMLSIAGPATLVSAQTPALQPSPATEPPIAPKSPVTVAPAANDREIARRLEAILESTGFFFAPRVTVRQGVVTLDGGTDTQEHQRWAGDLAEKTQDVVAVVNRIKVDNDVGSTFERAGKELKAVYRQGVETWPLIVLASVILFVTWLAAKLVSFLARRFFEGRVGSPLLLSVLTRSFSIPTFLLGIYFILQVAGLTRLALTVLGGTGLIGIIIGFAFRDIAENFLASLLLSVRNPFRSGDLVEIAGHTGIVQNLNTRSTILLTLNGSHVQIPNATVYKSTIENFSSNPSRRADFAIGIGYDSSAAEAQKLVSQVLCAHPAVLDSPEPLVLVEELGAATVNLRVSFWFDSCIHSPAKINSALLRQAKNALLEAGIELPDPAREVVFPRGVPVTMLNGMDQLPQSGPIGTEKLQPAPPSADDSSDTTEGEGHSSSENQDLGGPPAGLGPESKENLLKS